jgi:hypothetical protein
MKELTSGVGGDSMLTCAGTQEPMMQAIELVVAGERLRPRQG